MPTSRLPAALRLAAVALLALCTACGAPRLTLFPDSSEPLQEFTLRGEGREKVLLLPLTGMISDTPREGLLRREPSVVEEVAAHLKRAEDDKDVRAVLLVINSPGGTVTASDIVHHELTRFKERHGARVAALMLDVAASGGYYASLAADHVTAHPSTITGSVGTIFLRPNVKGLMDKVGVDVHVNKSGGNKDMGSPFTAFDPGQDALLQRMVDEVNARFLTLVRERRGLDEAAMAVVADARAMTATQALDLGLIDRIGYMDDALAQAKKLAGLPDDARLVVYRRRENANDTPYDLKTALFAGRSPSLVDLGAVGQSLAPSAGLYHLWAPEH